MAWPRIKDGWAEFRGICNLKSDDARGRLIYLSSVAFTAFYNIFISGIFYTGFLSMYDISIAGVGIVGFIPFIANLFSVYSSRILSRFQKRKTILLIAKTAYFTLKIVAVTIMPEFVTDPNARLIWFIGLTFVAHVVFAPFSPGITMWFYRFYPQDNSCRTVYLKYISIVNAITNTVVLIICSVLTDAVAGSPMQGEIIAFSRYLAFAMTLVETGIQFMAKEYPEHDDANTKLRDVFTLPLKYPRFLRCVVLMFIWTFSVSLYSGTWNYHLLNHLQFSYTLINMNQLIYLALVLLLGGRWERMVGRYSWIKTFGIAALIYAPTEIVSSVMPPHAGWLYLANCTIQNVSAVGSIMASGNIVYMNLPKENSTSHIAFYTIGTNISSLIGMLVGTWISSWTGDSAVSFMGLQLYSVQLTNFLRAVMLFIISYILINHWRWFTSDETILTIEKNQADYEHVK